MDEFLRVEGTDRPGVAVLRIDRPPVNALHPDMWWRFGQIVDEIATADHIHSIVIWGGPEVFAAGADIKAMEGMTMLEYRQSGTALQSGLARLAELAKISIAAINGYALGGGLEIALAADFRIMAEDAAIGLPEIKLGIMPGAGGTQRLQRLVGVGRAKELVLTGRTVRAEEAQQIGLVTKVVAPGDVFGEALGMAERFAQGPAALGLAKQALQDGGEMALGEALRLESSLLAACFATEDAQTGLVSFAENGPGRAQFSGQ